MRNSSLQNDFWLINEEVRIELEYHHLITPNEIMSLDNNH